LYFAYRTERGDAMRACLKVRKQGQKLLFASGTSTPRERQAATDPPGGGLGWGIGYEAETRPRKQVENR